MYSRIISKVDSYKFKLKKSLLITCNWVLLLFALRNRILVASFEKSSAKTSKPKFAKKIASYPAPHPGIKIF